MSRELVVVAAVLAALWLIAESAVGTWKKVVLDVAEAIKEFEGWHVGSRSYRNNNPGNLKYNRQRGATGEDDQGHAIFETYEAGWEALCAQLDYDFSGRSTIYRPSWSLYDFFGKYAEGNSVEYAEFVAERLGVDPETTLAELYG